MSAQIIRHDFGPRSGPHLSDLRHVLCGLTGQDIIEFIAEISPQSVVVDEGLKDRIVTFALGYAPRWKQRP